MPLRPCAFRDVKRKLQNAGFVEVSQVGSHVKFAKTVSEGTRTAIVPNHGEIGRGTLRSVLRQAGISEEEWNRL